MQSKDSHVWTSCLDLSSGLHMRLISIFSSHFPKDSEEVCHSIYGTIPLKLPLGLWTLCDIDHRSLTLTHSTICLHVCLASAPYQEQYNFSELACTAVSELRLTPVCTAAVGENHFGIDLQIPELGDFFALGQHIKNNRKHILGHTLEQVV